jgi:hypothetical protein
MNDSPKTQRDADQLAYDLADANLRVERMQAAILAKDNAEAEVARLARELKQARRRLKEAAWKLTLATAAERRKGSPG